MTAKGGLFHAVEVSTGVIWSLEDDGTAGSGHRHERERSGMMHGTQFFCVAGDSDQTSVGFDVEDEEWWWY